jgi:hypothetical protein
MSIAQQQLMVKFIETGRERVVSETSFVKSNVAINEIMFMMSFQPWSLDALMN